ncbi:peptidoglycan L-alanyl-D-glutamate endopeptidase CwlK [Salibacterium salarium]|uniref:M15 family metallopeptidase n=1 Tax=Salibacterium salarium TaxID=284579 RepID=UPI002783BF90|nr:M15 family metallopeptidase [Salibacterium salarium]MDQ0300170.1 peptidoglycan L-alanyl-D-glutamate endopeptidase CwlK [Salibacterium salarium]
MKWNAGWDVALLVLFAAGLFFYWHKEQEQITEQLAEQKKLHPKVVEMKEELVDRADSQDIQVVVTEGYRSEKKQNELYEEGRSKEGSVVTHAKGGESYHNYGLAIDFALEQNDGELTWDTEYDGNENGRSDWMETVDIAKNLGFEWGGDWNHFEDPVHLQWNPGVSIRELQRENNK